MDLAYFLRERTNLIRLFYEKGRLPFEQMKQDIEDEVPPWAPPPFNPETDDPEPPFVAEWMQAEQTRELIGMLAVSLLSDTLKLYFDELEQEIGIAFTDDKARRAHFKQGWVEAYRQILQRVMGEAYATCPVRFDLIEQVVLARNDFAHNSDFVTFQTRHNKQTLEKHPNPFFVELRHQPESTESRFPDDGDPPSWRAVKIEVSRENLMTAIEEIEKLADWVQQNDEAIWEWRRRAPKTDT